MLGTDLAQKALAGEPKVLVAAGWLVVGLFHRLAAGSLVAGSPRRIAADLDLL